MSLHRLTKIITTPTGIITVIDAAHVLQHLDEEKPEGVENECHEQVAFADKILLNKLDLLGDDGSDFVVKQKRVIFSRLRQINALCEIKETGLKFDILTGHLEEELLNVNAFKLDRILAMEPEFLTDLNAEHLHDDRVTSVGIERRGELDLAKLNHWLGQLLKKKGVDIFRCKGILAIQGSDRKFVFHGIHMVLQTEESAALWSGGEVWRRLNRLVFIGRNLDRAELEQGFAGCLADVRDVIDHGGNRNVLNEETEGGQAGPKIPNLALAEAFVEEDGYGLAPELLGDDHGDLEVDDDDILL